MTREKMVSKVLEIKEYATERLEAEVRRAREKLGSEQEKLDSLEKTHASTCSEFTGRQMKGALPVREMELYYAYLKHLARQIEQQKKIVAVRRKEAEERQQAVVEAYKEQRLIEILHGKMVSYKVKQADQTEQKEMDYSFLARKGQR